MRAQCRRRRRRCPASHGRRCHRPRSRGSRRACTAPASACHVRPAAWRAGRRGRPSARRGAWRERPTASPQTVGCARARRRSGRRRSGQGSGCSTIGAGSSHGNMRGQGSAHRATCPSDEHLGSGGQPSPL
eukprot:5885371-Prymnesium_polylepis.1